jgi:hypothetical protein
MTVANAWVDGMLVDAQARTIIMRSMSTQLRPETQANLAHVEDQHPSVRVRPAPEHDELRRVMTIGRQLSRLSDGTSVVQATRSGRAALRLALDVPAADVAAINAHAAALAGARPPVPWKPGEPLAPAGAQEIPLRTTEVLRASSLTMAVEKPQFQPPALRPAESSGPRLTHTPSSGIPSIPEGATAPLDVMPADAPPAALERSSTQFVSGSEGGAVGDARLTSPSPSQPPKPWDLEHGAPEQRIATGWDEDEDEGMSWASHMSFRRDAGRTPTAWDTANAFTRLVVEMAVCNAARFAGAEDDESAQTAKTDPAGRQVLGDASDSGLLRYADAICPVEELRERLPPVFQLPFNSNTKIAITARACNK